MREYRSTRGNGLKNAVSSHRTVVNGYVTVGNGWEWFYLSSHGTLSTYRSLVRLISHSLKYSWL